MWPSSIIIYVLLISKLDRTSNNRVLSTSRLLPWSTMVRAVFALHKAQMQMESRTVLVSTCSYPLMNTLNEPRRQLQPQRELSSVMDVRDVPGAGLINLHNRLSTLVILQTSGNRCHGSELHSRLKETGVEAWNSPMSFLVSISWNLAGEEETSPHLNSAPNICLQMTILDSRCVDLFPGWGSFPKGPWGFWLRAVGVDALKRQRVLPPLVLVNPQFTGVGFGVSVSLCNILQIHQMVSRHPSLTYNFQHRKTVRHTRRHLIAIKPWLAFRRCLFEWNIILSFRFCSLKHWHMSHSAPPQDKHESVSHTQHQFKASGLHQMSF